jgi:hypothetical protein
MRSKADVPVSDVPVGRYRITTPQLRCRPVVRVRLGPHSAVPGLPRRMGKPCAGSDLPDNVEALHPTRRETAIPITTMASASSIQF